MERRDQVDASGAIDNRIEDMLLFDYTSTCSIETKLSIIYYHLKKQKQKFLFFFVVFQVSFNIFFCFFEIHSGCLFSPSSITQSLRVSVYWWRRKTGGEARESSGSNWRHSSRIVFHRTNDLNYRRNEKRVCFLFSLFLNRKKLTNKQNN